MWSQAMNLVSEHRERTWGKNSSENFGRITRNFFDGNCTFRFLNLYGNLSIFSTFSLKNKCNNSAPHSAVISEHPDYFGESCGVGGCCGSKGSLSNFDMVFDMVMGG
jgi:hypothetical protein